MDTRANKPRMNLMHFLVHVSEFIFQGSVERILANNCVQQFHSGLVLLFNIFCACLLGRRREARGSTEVPRRYDTPEQSSQVSAVRRLKLLRSTRISCFRRSGVVVRSSGHKSNGQGSKPSPLLSKTGISQASIFQNKKLN